MVQHNWLRGHGDSLRERFVIRQDEAQFSIRHVLLMVGTIAISAATYTWLPSPFTLGLPLMVGLIWIGRWMQTLSDRIDHRFIDDRSLAAKIVSIGGSILMLVGCYYVLAFTIAHLMMFAVWASNG